MRRPPTGYLVFLILSISSPSAAQDSPIHGAVRRLEDYLTIASGQTAQSFRPLTQKERTELFRKSMLNTWGFAKAAASAGLDQWNNKPPEWGQGWDAYGKRFAHIQGQYTIQKTVSYLISSGLHEDNRYFNSGRQGFWPRSRYAVASSFLARNDNGKLRISVSQLSGIAAGAAISRTWLPTDQRSVGDAAASFGITLAGNCAISVVKEFLPDLLRPLTGNKHTRPPAARR